ncbi:hypothetical protein SmJEL517_g04537 [Synchytrium microbalum]|uniref:ABC transporter domain-containing protein n=1 Tax=Synchytrium microbalum TaxID=1806994 RepID=A0A507C4L7_9FUNG|nr:uncharacterized protein SmJEL517_g04537 [Synchytrium microbalum]TPX32375.1 hypothetical protein SmJEL517_g04537 [Synchytrium microbalum]
MGEKKSIGITETSKQLHGYTLTFENISCHVNSGSIFNRTVVAALESASGYVEPGTSLAVLGASGAGKTTLVDILSGRKNVGKVGGTYLVNGKRPDRFFRMRAGYVTYDMAHVPTMTVSETVLFAARCRMPRGTTDAEHRARVDQVLQQLRLSHIADTYIGDELVRGVSTGEKKRTEIATEMVASPRVMFLDEPTSGLDDYGAKFTMQLVLQYVKAENVTVVTVIHQPSEAVFNLFDSCLLLGAGRTCYFGPIPAAREFYATMGHPVPELTNAIEHYLDVIAAAPLDSASYYASSAVGQANDATLKNLILASSGQSLPQLDFSDNLYETTVFRQFYLNLVRTIQRYRRNPSTSFGRVFVSSCISLIFGAIFWRVSSDHSIGGLRNATSLVSALAFLPAFTAGAAIPQFLEDRALYIQETASAFYSPMPYYLAYSLVENTVTMVVTLIQATIVFYMAQLNPTYFGLFIAMLIMQSWISTASTQMISAWSKTLVQAYTALISYGLVLFLFSGGQSGNQQLSPVLAWIPYISYWRWTVQYLLYQTTRGYVLICDPTSIIPLPMNGIIPIIDASVGASLNSTITRDLAANATNYAFVKTQLGYIQSLSAVNTSVLAPYVAAGAIPASVFTTVATNEGAAFVQALPYLPAGSSAATLTGQVTYAGAIGLWDGASVLAKAPFAVYPDLSYCAVPSADSFIESIYNVNPNSPNANATSYGYAFLFFVIHWTLGYIGILVSRTYKAR